jgi:hypothetical protein
LRKKEQERKQQLMMMTTTTFHCEDHTATPNRINKITKQRSLFELTPLMLLKLFFFVYAAGSGMP